VPLLDHFHPPLSTQRHWESFHTTWAGAIADALNDRLLPEGYFAEEQVHPSARVEIDVATFESDAEHTRERHSSGVGTALAAPPPAVWSPPAPAATIPLTFPEQFEVRVFSSEGGPTLVAAIELISPANKDRPAERRAFVTKCASYLHQGVALIVVDAVTSRAASWHNDLLRLLDAPAQAMLPDTEALYAAAYRPLRSNETDLAEVWVERLAVGRRLPTLPLALNSGCVLPLDLEATYDDACRRRRVS
jgi:hypothetical protein